MKKSETCFGFQLGGVNTAYKHSGHAFSRRLQRFAPRTPICIRVAGRRISITSSRAINRSAVQTCPFTAKHASSPVATPALYKTLKPCLI